MNHSDSELESAYKRISPDLMEAYIHNFKGDHQSLLEVFASYVRLENMRTRHHLYRLFLDDGTIGKPRIAQELEALEAQMDKLVMYLDSTIP
jgi:hypothetical protein